MTYLDFLTPTYLTGGNISNIDGLIKANGNANLFLINPAGIIFGENARLDIGGSFLGSTAESILFEDGFNYSAIDSQGTPLLTVSVPLGLQMGTNSGGIKVQGDGYTATSRNTFSPLTVTSFNGMRVKEGNTLALVGNKVSLNGGIVAADSGRVELGAANEGLVNINSNGLILDYNGIENFGFLELSSIALVDVSGTGSGSIQLQGRNISIKDGSKVYVQSSGNIGGGEIKATATDSIELVGTSPDGNLGSAFLAETLGVGNAAGITILTPRLLVSQGAGISSETFSPARGGDITINASESIQVGDFSAINLSQNSAIATLSLNSGETGDINILTKQLSLLGQGIYSNSFATGTGGNISISTDKLTALDGGVISTVTLGLGSGGDINLNAEEIELIGFNSNTFTPSSLSAATIGKTEAAAAGSLTINTRSLILKDGGRVDSSTLASGAAGSIIVNARDFVEISGTVPGSVNPSLIISSANIVDEFLQQAIGIPAIPSGDSGNVTINTPVLKVSDGAEITVRNDGTGKGGILNINVDSILLNSTGKITASTQSGAGGNINLLLKDSLILRNQSVISAEAGGTGDGGDITINSPVIAGFENSDVIANAFQGNGGNIDITTQGIFGLEFRDELTEENDITASSQFGINGTVEINNLSIDPSSGLTELPVTLTDSSQQIASGCSSNTGNSFVATGRGGIPQNPNEQVSLNPTWSDIRDLSAFSQNNNKVENTQISKQISNKPAIVEATGFIRNSNGEIELVTLSPKPLTTKQISECSGSNT